MAGGPKPAMTPVWALMERVAHGGRRGAPLAAKEDVACANCSE